MKSVSLTIRFAIITVGWFITEVSFLVLHSHVVNTKHEVLKTLLEREFKKSYEI